jgi:hypothetical protein
MMGRVGPVATAPPIGEDAMPARCAVDLTLGKSAKACAPPISLGGEAATVTAACASSS